MSNQIYKPELEATHLRNRLFAVRPKGCLGTCGWIGEKGWTVVYVKANNAQQAVVKVERRQS